MYLEYWQLETKPFEPTPESSLVYPSESQEAALLKLRYAIDSDRGAAALAGPSGVGKTLVVERLATELAERGDRLVHVVFPQMSERELLAYLASQIGAPEVESPRHTTDESLQRLEQFFESAPGSRIVLAVDEAQVLEDCGTLQTLRLLLNFKSGERPAVTLLLVGQMGLISSIGRYPELEERLAVKAIVRTFTLDETADYVRYRIAGAGASRDLFTPEALEEIHCAAGGAVRRINRLCDLALLVGFSDRAAVVDRGCVESVAAELALTVSDPQI